MSDFSIGNTGNKITFTGSTIKLDTTSLETNGTNIVMSAGDLISSSNDNCSMSVSDISASLSTYVNGIYFEDETYGGILKYVSFYVNDEEQYLQEGKSGAIAMVSDIPTIPQYIEIDSVNESIYFTNTSGYTGLENVIIGYNAAPVMLNESNNTIVGGYAGNALVNANSNTFVGFKAGFACITGSSNVFIGNFAGSTETRSDRFIISNGITPELLRGDFSVGSIEIGNGISSGVFSFCGGNQDGAYTLKSTGFASFNFSSAVSKDSDVAGTQSAILGGADNTVSGVSSVILGGQINTIDNGSRCAIIGGSGNYINNGVSKSVILGGTNITGSTDNTVYTNNQEIVGSGNGIIMASPDGTRYKLTIANGGIVDVSAV